MIISSHGDIAPGRFIDRLSDYMRRFCLHGPPGAQCTARCSDAHLSKAPTRLPEHTEAAQFLLILRASRSNCSDEAVMRYAALCFETACPCEYLSHLSASTAASYLPGWSSLITMHSSGARPPQLIVLPYRRADEMRGSASQSSASLPPAALFPDGALMQSGVVTLEFFMEVREH